MNSHTNAQDTSAYDYYEALEKYENKNYEKALSNFDILIKSDYNNKNDYFKQIKYWSQYSKACIYYSLSIEKIQKRRPFAEVKQSLLIAKENFEEAKKISETFPNSKGYNKQESFIAFCKIDEAGSCYCLGKLTFEERQIDATEYFIDVTNYLKSAQNSFQCYLIFNN